METLRHTIEALSSLCAKCKPKLIVNPMPLATQSSGLSPSGKGGLAGSSGSSEYFQQKEQMKEVNYMVSVNKCCEQH